MQENPTFDVPDREVSPIAQQRVELCHERQDVHLPTGVAEFVGVIVGHDVPKDLLEDLRELLFVLEVAGEPWLDLVDQVGIVDVPVRNRESNILQGNTISREHFGIEIIDSSSSGGTTTSSCDESDPL